LNPNEKISDLVRELKNNSSNFINNSGFSHHKFAWAEGYGAFSYSKSEINNVYEYIKNQEEHHKKTTFKDEYIGLLNEFEIEFKDEYLFDWISLEK